MIGKGALEEKLDQLVCDQDRFLPGVVEVVRKEDPYALYLLGVRRVFIDIDQF